MNKIILALIGFIIVSSSSGQELVVKVQIDTLKIIKTEKIPTKEIGFGIPNGKVFISKSSLIEVWDNELSLWEEELNNNSRNKDWQIENYKISESYLDYIKRQKTLFIKYLNADSASQFAPTTDTIALIENQLKEIVCNLLDIGEFEVQINNKIIENVIKAKVRRTTKYSETISTVFIVNDSIHFWSCPPIIRSDFAIDSEDMYVPEPPKD